MVPEWSQSHVSAAHALPLQRQPPVTHMAPDRAMMARCGGD